MQMKWTKCPHEGYRIELGIRHSASFKNIVNCSYSNNELKEISGRTNHNETVLKFKIPLL